MTAQYTASLPLNMHLGATAIESGVNFVLFSSTATAVELVLYRAVHSNQKHSLRDMDVECIGQFPLTRKRYGLWGVFIQNLGDELYYGYRVLGEDRLELGHAFDESLVMLDPYARHIIRVNQSNCGFGVKLLGQVRKTCFDWGDDKTPSIPWKNTTIYEVHVKGFSKLNASVPEILRGTYLGLSHPESIEHFKKLGISSLQIMPCIAFTTSEKLRAQKLENYWGYDPIAFFAPSSRYAVEDPVKEFKTMVAQLHQAGIEVILDMVLNHTGEGGMHEQTYSFRGIDNTTYYQTTQQLPKTYIDHTLCGNSLNIEHPQVFKLILDSLRYWVSEMHVDGFRLVLAPKFSQEHGGFSRDNSFFKTIFQDPVLSQVKWIAEPWDKSPQGYQLGQYPAQWSEWNDQYRNCVRAFWRGDKGMAGSLASAINGSEDVFGYYKERTSASINYITSHDGFTLQDLVSYAEKHNQANGENNKDGMTDNLSCNYGIEGPTADAMIEQNRDRHKRSMLATLMLSKGTPMILSGDEFANSQSGNNNPYCQDNELTWLDWLHIKPHQELFDFTSQLIQLRQAIAPLNTDDFYRNEANIYEALWIDTRGEKFVDWNLPEAKVIGLIWLPQQKGKTIWSLFFNADERDCFIDFNQLCGAQKIEIEKGFWQLDLDTFQQAAFSKKSLEHYTISSRSVVVFSFHFQ
ncbi:MAG: glycogen debranching protein GlgX [Pseudomonadota bacterium]